MISGPFSFLLCSILIRHSISRCYVKVFKSLNSGILAVGIDYVDGTISVDWSKVIHLQSSQLFVVLAEDGSSYEGTLNTAKAAASVPMSIEVMEAVGKKVQVERSQIVRMTETSEKFIERFNGAVNMEVIYSKGNSTTQYNFGTEVEYLRERWAATTFFSSNLSSNSTSTASTRNQLQLSGYHLLPWENYFYGGLGNFLQSSEQGIRLQTTVGGGLGHFFKNTQSTSISACRALTTGQFPRFMAQRMWLLLCWPHKLSSFKFKKNNLDLNALVLPALSDPGRIRFNTNATYYIKLFKNLDWNTSFYGNWDNRPPHGLSGSDYGASSGFSWTFGNK